MNKIALKLLTDEELQELSMCVESELSERKNAKIRKVREAIYTKIDEIKEIYEEYNLKCFINDPCEPDIYFDWGDIDIIIE